MVIFLAQPLSLSLALGFDAPEKLDVIDLHARAPCHVHISLSRDVSGIRESVACILKPSATTRTHHHSLQLSSPYGTKDEMMALPLPKVPLLSSPTSFRI